MSDYLGNLAARSLASETAPPAVRPRPASHFEPPAPGAAPLWSEAAAAADAGFVEEAVEVAVPPPARSRPRRPRRSRPSSEGPVPSDPRVLDPPLPTRGGRRRTTETGTLPRAGSPLPASESLERPDEPPGERPAAKPDRAADADGRARPRLSAVRGDEPAAFRAGALTTLARLVPPAEAEQPAAVLRVRRADPLQRPPEARAPEVRRHGARERDGSPPAVADGGGPHPAPLRPLLPAADRRAVSARPEPAVAEPVVHVTIGRIEVRAAPAPRPPARERHAARPPVDLDEYLQQRSGGATR